MCTPVLGAVIGGGQAVLGHMGQVQAATQRNKNRAALYNAEKAKVEQQHRINIQNYYLRGVDAKDTWDENALEASIAREKQELLLNEAVATAFQGMEGDYIKLQSDQRISRYAEGTGVTAQRGRTALKSAIGRAKATRQAAVDMQHDRARTALQEITVAKDKADREARDMIGMEPERGPGPVKPKWDKGPSMLSLIVNTAIGAYGGYKMGKQLQGLKPGSAPPTSPITEQKFDMFDTPNMQKLFTQGRNQTLELPSNFYDHIEPIPGLPIYEDYSYLFNIGLPGGVKK